MENSYVFKAVPSAVDPKSTSFLFSHLFAHKCRLTCLHGSGAPPQELGVHPPLALPVQASQTFSHPLSVILCPRHWTQLFRSRSYAPSSLSPPSCPALPFTHPPPTAMVLLPPGVSSCAVPRVYVSMVFFYTYSSSQIELRIIQHRRSQAAFEGRVLLFFFFASN